MNTAPKMREVPESISAEPGALSHYLIIQLSHYFCASLRKINLLHIKPYHIVTLANYHIGIHFAYQPPINISRIYPLL